MNRSLIAAYYDKQTLLCQVYILRGDTRGKYFGTDGFRGEANVTPDAFHAYRIGRFLGWYYASPLWERANSGQRPRVVIGKDTRRSGYMFEYAIAAGLTASGADAYMLHVTTTPGVSFVTRQESFDCGIMISASHNPYTDNGIKLMGAHGEKMDDATVEMVEAYLDHGAAGLIPFAANRPEIRLPEGDLPYATGADIGRIIDHVAGRNRYVGYLISLAANSYKHYRVGLDCANGASWSIAPAVFEALGAKTYVMGAEPNGVNINREVGSTHTERLRRLVREKSLDVGFAFDGDADRCIAVDENGNEINGDHILYVLGKSLSDQGNLAGNTVVTTIMSNMGLYQALDAAGIHYVKTTVGDRFVYERMVEEDFSLGGEQSGHVILKKYATTGDGILTAIMLMEEMAKTKLPLSKLASPVVMYPQVCLNVAVKNQDGVLHHPAVREKHAEISRRLGENGRILLRKSGTEPVLRIMVEASGQDLCHAYAMEMKQVMEQVSEA